MHLLSIWTVFSKLPTSNILRHNCYIINEIIGHKSGGTSLPFCSKCGKAVTEEMNVCPNCGNVLRITPTSRVTVGTKNPGVAAVLSLFIPGLGQIYSGRIGRGLLMLFVVVPLSAILALFFFWLLIPLLLPLAVWIWNIFDANNICKEYNRRLMETGNPPW